MKLTAHAKIQVLVEVSAPGTYGADWTLDKLMEQVTREALAHLGAVIHNGCEISKTDARSVRVVGEPKIVDVTMRETT